MNKMKKLLSVVLAVVLALSCMSVMASAAKTAYKTVDELTALDAYSPYGQVTRLSTEERSSMLLDFLDSVLPGLNINMGTVVDVLGLTVIIDLTSVDRLLDSFDSFKSTLSNGLFSIAAGIVNLGVLESLTFDSWQADMSRAGTAQYTILFEIVELLSKNTSAINSVLTDGIQLGMIGGMIKGLDLSSINEMVVNLPKMVKGLIFPLFNRWDDTMDEVNALETAISGSGSVTAFLGTKVGNYFQKPMSLTTVKADVNGNMTSDHVLPTDGTRRIFAISADKKTITVSEYQTQRVVDKNKTDDIVAVGYMELDKYVLQPEVVDAAGNPVEDTAYVYKCLLLDEDNQPVVDEKTGKQVYGETLKFYKPGSYWLVDFKNDNKTIDINAESGAALLYKMIPYVFDAMAPVVVNGSLKKLLAELFGAQWKNLGNITKAEVLAEVKTLPGYNASLEIFGEQGEYLWEWSAFDKITVDGVDYFYYRFQDDLYVADTTKCNDYFNIINWDYAITGDFFNEFIPTGATGTEKSAAGYTRLLHGFNDFIVKVANTVLVNGAKDIAGTKTLSITLTKGDNSKLVGNIKALAQALLGFHPEHIFGETYDAEGNVTGYGSYYDLIMEQNNNDLVLTGIAALVIDALAPQTHLPDAASLRAQNVKVGGLLAAMLRELATQLVPSINYDALIYSNYNTMTFVANKDNSYWLDVLLTMGTDIGFKYLTAFADMNEDKFADYYVKGGCIDWQLSRTYTEADLKLTSAVNLWEQRVDFIIDWALYTDKTGTYAVWNMNNFVQEYLDAAGCTYDVATAEDPFKKVDAIFDNILFFDQFTSETDLETALRGTILDLVNLKWENILGTETEKGLLDIPANSKLRTTNLVNALTLEVKDLLNSLFKNVGGGSYSFIPDSITTIDQLLTQANIKTVAVNLVAQLDDALNNGLLDTALPILGFFLGWKTDPQAMADPNVWMTNRDGNDYTFIYTTEGNAISNTVLHILNGSSGMLETHRNSSTVDHEYQIKIESITSDAKDNTVKFTIPDSVISPYEQVDVTVSGTYAKDEAITITMAYSYIGKDGKPVGDTQYKTIYTFISGLYEDANINGRFDGDDDTDYTGIDEWKKYQFTEDIYTTVTTFAPAIFWVEPTINLGTKSKDFKNIAAPDWDEKKVNCETVKTYYNLEGHAPTYFEFITSQSEAGWPSKINKNETVHGKLFKAKSGVTKDTEFPYGIYDMGRVAVAYGSDNKQWMIDYIYYNDYDVYETMTEYTGKSISAFAVDSTDSAAVAAYNRYNTALKNIVRLATYPMMTTAAGSAESVDYVTTIMPQIKPAQEEIKAAYEALVPFMEAKQDADASATGAATGIGMLQAQLETDDGDGEAEINFQDYAYYEYFNYADLRTEARNLAATYEAPELMDTYYILGSGIREAELNKVIAAETNAVKKAAITASRSENDPLAIEAAREANESFQAPTNSYLYLADFANRLAYYKTFLAANKVAADLTFLTKEIGYADANYPAADEALYTADSWANYAAKLAEAKAITSADIPSDVFEAKYNLMVAMKNLLLKSESAIEAGATAELIALKDKAEAIFAMNYDEIELSDVALEKELTKDEALGHLLYAMGYYYEGEDGETWNLYDNSAYEYIDNDRPNKSTNVDKIDACAENLEACLAYFVTEVALPELAPVEGSTGAFGETTDVDGVATGYIYGVTAGTEANKYFTLVDDTAGTVEWAASTLSTAGTVDGTGAVATVKDTNGNTVAVYTLVVFGDVNGDGEIKGADLNDVNLCLLAGTTDAFNEVQVFAADVTGDGDIKAADKNDINLCLTSGSYDSITVNPYLVG